MVKYLQLLVSSFVFDIRLFCGHVTPAWSQCLFVPVFEFVLCFVVWPMRPPAMGSLCWPTGSHWAAVRL